MPDTTIVFISDLHIGHTLSLCPAKWTLHDGHEFRPNPLQDIIREHWLATWQRIAEQRKKRRLVVCLVGDACEGLHHDSTQIITARLDTQEDMAAAVINEALSISKFNPRRGDVLRAVTGTPAHDGPGAASLERVMRQVLHYNGDHRQTRDRWLVDINKTRFDVAHQPGSGPGTRTWVRGNAFQAWLRSVYLDALESGDKPPRFIIRAHRHVYVERHVHNGAGNVVVTGYILPPWQAKTEYVYQVVPEAVTAIGALVLDIDSDGTTRTRCDLLRLEQDEAEVL